MGGGGGESIWSTAQGAGHSCLEEQGRRITSLLQGHRGRWWLLTPLSTPLELLLVKAPRPSPGECRQQTWRLPALEVMAITLAELQMPKAAEQTSPYQKPAPRERQQKEVRKLPPGGFPGQGPHSF